jgi:hypothetical protein
MFFTLAMLMCLCCVRCLCQGSRFIDPNFIMSHINCIISSQKPLTTVDFSNCWPFEKNIIFKQQTTFSSKFLSRNNTKCLIFSKICTLSCLKQIHYSECRGISWMNTFMCKSSMNLQVIHLEYICQFLTTSI